MLYKIIQQIVDIPKSNLMPALDYYCTHYLEPFARTDMYYYSLFPLANGMWNSLLQEVCNLQTLL